MFWFNEGLTEVCKIQSVGFYESKATLTWARRGNLRLAKLCSWYEATEQQLRGTAPDRPRCVTGT